MKYKVVRKMDRFELLKNEAVLEEFEFNEEDRLGSQRAQAKAFKRLDQLFEVEKLCKKWVEETL